jgi:sulfatase modifying factor 1
MSQQLSDSSKRSSFVDANPLEPEMVPIPAGWFLMGSDKRHDPQAWEDELPQHRVYLDAYAMGKYPVTVSQFAAFVAATSYRTTAEAEGWSWAWDPQTGRWGEVKGASWRHPQGPGSDVADKAQHPVTHVSWDDVAEYCRWLSRVTGQEHRLPSEAEWEKAARGADGRIYPWGADPPTDKHCNFNMKVGDTTPVAAYPGSASPYGCLDMAGNVWEWAADWYSDGYYALLPSHNPTGLAAGSHRVGRGGSFDFDSRNMRCAVRLRLIPDYRDWNLGFRVASLGL